MTLPLKLTDKECELLLIGHQEMALTLKLITHCPLDVINDPPDKRVQYWDMVKLVANTALLVSETTCPKFLDARQLN